MRKSKPKKRIILPDPKFNDVLVTRFVNDLMVDGKKTVAYSVFYDAMDLVSEKLKNEELSPLEIWKKALENITPQVEVKSRRVGGANFQVPMEIRPERKISISIKNYDLFARKLAAVDMSETCCRNSAAFTKKVEHTNGRKKFTVWQMLTVLSLISVFSII